MSAWTLDALDTAVAREWLTDVMQTTDFSLLEEALELVLDTTEGYLERADAERACAAAELTAAALAHPGPTFAEHAGLARWLTGVRTNPDAELVRAARRATARVLAPDSELREVWEDSDAFDAWLAGLYDLRERLLP